MADQVKLEHLVYSAINQNAKLPPALSPATDSLQKCLDLSLGAPPLSFDGQNTQDMWQTINAYAKSYAGGKPVNPVPSDCKTVADVWNAVSKANP
jgi:hypothetical protein